MAVNDEIPDTEFGINQYVKYCKKAIIENKNHINRMKVRIKSCYSKAERLGIKIIEEEE